MRYISSEEARSQQSKANKDDAETIEAIKEASNRMPATLRINLEDINKKVTNLELEVEKIKEKVAKDLSK